MVAYRQVFGETGRFFINPKWWGMFFLADFLFFAGGIGFFLSQPAAFAGIFSLLGGGGVPAVEALGGLAALAGLFAAWFFVKFLVTGAYAYHAGGDRWKDGYHKAVRRYPYVLVVAILFSLLNNSGIIAGVDGLVATTIRLVVNIIVVLLFGFALSAVTVGKKGVVGSFRESAIIFFHRPVGVIGIQAAVVAFAITVGVLAAVGSTSLLVSLFASGIVAPGADSGTVALVLAGQLPLLVAAGAVMAFGSALMQAFGLALQVKFYLAVRKGEKGL